MNIVLYSDDINLLSYWEKSFKENSISLDDIEELKSLKNSIVIINYSAFNSKQKEIIETLNDSMNLVLVLHRVPNIKTAREVLSFGAKGYGNAMMREHFLHSAVETMKEGMLWLNPEFSSDLIMQIPNREEKNLSLLDSLSKREKAVALLLKDGDTYKIVGEKLEITPRTVKAHAQGIYKKLEIKDRLALALLLK